MAKIGRSADHIAEDYVTDITIPVWKKFVFTLTDFGSPMTVYFVSAFLVTYFTGVALVPMASISLLLGAVRVLDAVIDPVIGSLQDRSNRKNRYRPWAISCTILTAISVVGIFLVPVEWDTNAKIAWLWVFYIIYTIVSSVRNMAYKAFCGVVTSNGMERTKIGSFRGMMTSVGSNLPGVVAIPLITYFSISGGVLDRRGYLITLLIFVVVGLPLAVFPPLTLNERIRKPPSQQKFSAKTVATCLVKNPPMIFCLVGFFMFGLLLYGRMSFQFYFFLYNTGNVGWYSVASSIQLIFSIVSSALIPTMFKLTKNKGYVCAIGLLVSALGSFGMHYFHNSNIVMISIFIALISLGTTVFSAMNMALIGDAADNAELKFGIRVDGFLNASASMLQQLGAAITPAIGSAMLGALGFVSGAESQPAAVLNAISVNTWLIPAVLSVASGVMFLFYKLNDARHKEIVAQLEERRRQVALAGKSEDGAAIPALAE